MKERAEQAAVYKRSCNCCQAVLCALADQTGLSAEQLMEMGAGFGLGMGNMEGTCGALAGAAIAAGLATHAKGTASFAKKLNDNFCVRSGAILCKDLKGRDTGKILCSCEDCVRNAVLAYGDITGLADD